ncbi:MAG TPA: DUF1697 domain-containing protein [Gemmatimonadaceae bacterium]|nr:DUF1697 domain-containing protein [Gemmatimonadaceae bacterium]
MPRYVAFLRGVTPQNLAMARLRAAMEQAGFADVRTVLSSGNVAFSTRATGEESLARRVESAIASTVGRPFAAIVRGTDVLDALLASDPFAALAVPSGAKRVVTFLRAPHAGTLRFPIARDGASILGMREREAFTAYLPHPKGPVFMTLIEQTFGTEVTTRTWDTVRKCAAA